MNITTISAILIALAAIGYLIYKQIIQQPVSRRDFLLPVIALVYAGMMFVNTRDLSLLLSVLLGGGLGVATGLVSGQVVRVWRDNSSGMVFQRGGWSYVLVLLGLLIARILIYIILHQMGIVTGASGLNYAFISLALGNYLGRTMNIHLRAMPLTNKPIHLYQR